jgi:hypothetical protein
MLLLYRLQPAKGSNHCIGESQFPKAGSALCLNMKSGTNAVTYG